MCPAPIGEEAAVIRTRVCMCKGGRDLWKLNVCICVYMYGMGMVVYISAG